MGWLNIDDSGHPERLIAHAPEAKQCGAGRVAPLVDIGGLGDAPQLLADATRLEDAPDLVVEVHGARERVGLGPPLQHHDGSSELAEQDRERRADRPVPDDRNVGVGVSRHPRATG